MFTRRNPLLTYADNLDIVGRSLQAVTDAFQAQAGPASRLGLVVNESKKNTW